MRCKSSRRSGIAGLTLGLASVVGCGGGEPLPTNGAGRPGPAIPQGILKKGAVGKGRAKAGAVNAIPTPSANAGRKPGP
jgi:hypothetical protein